MCGGKAGHGAGAGLSYRLRGVPDRTTGARQGLRSPPTVVLQLRRRRVGQGLEAAALDYAIADRLGLPYSHTTPSPSASRMY